MITVGVDGSDSLEDEDRVAVFDHLHARIIEEIAANVGRDVADIDIADALGDLSRLAVLAPAVQHMGNPRIGKQRVVRAVGAVHGDDVGKPPRGVGAAEIGCDANAARRVDIIGRMAGIGDRNLLDFGRQAAKTRRHCAGWCLGHRKAFAAGRNILRGGRCNQEAEQAENEAEGTQHGRSHPMRCIRPL